MKFILLFLLFIIYSFIGWLLEIAYCFVKEKKIINRGFLIGPYCPIYGLGCILIITLLERYENNILVLFVMSMFICSILEYLISFTLEKLFNARWWNYADRKYNINGRICLEMLVPFGILGVFMIKVMNKPIVNFIKSLPNGLVIFIFVVTFVIFMSDTLISYIVIEKLHMKSKKNIVDNTEEITQKVKEYILSNSWIGRRLIKSFPELKVVRKKKKIKKSSKGVKNEE